MERDDLLLFLQDIVEEMSILNYLKFQYTKYRRNNLEILKKIIIYGLKNNLLELTKYIRKGTLEESYYINFDIEESISIIKDNKSWNSNDYSLCFVDTIKYYWILFGPYGPVGEHAFEGARIPEEFEQFIID